MLTIKPIADNVIAKIVPVEQKIGSILVTSDIVEKSSLAEVIIPNEWGYDRNGDRRESFLKTGDRVRLPKGQVGTEMPESPDGETWVCFPEDMILYIVSGE